MAKSWGEERRWVWEVSHVVGEWMVEALDPKPGETILELAAGAGDTGFAAAAALGDEGKLISTDFAPKMVEAAREASEELGLRNVEHRVLDAQDMDLEDSSVDGVLCRWGYMLMADPQSALHETRRVLRDGGRLALSVWGPPEANPWASIPGRLLLEQTGAPPPGPTAPGIFAMADPERTRSLLGGAGFEVKRMENVAMTWRHQDVDAYWNYLTGFAGALALGIEALSDEARNAYRARIETAVEPYKSNGGYDLPAVAQNTLAVQRA
jgi:SAM-dependent methyltransferase